MIQQHDVDVSQHEKPSDWNGWLPGGTNSRWSLVLGLAFFITGIGSLWGLNEVPGDDAMTLLFMSAGLLGINQLRRTFGRNEYQP